MKAEPGIKNAVESGTRRLARFFTEGFPPRSAYPRGLTGLYAYAMHVFKEMPPGLARIMRLQPLLALATSVVCIAFWRRGFEHIPVVVFLIILAIGCIALRLSLVRDRADSMLDRLSNFALLFALGNVLLFVLPFYLESITLPSLNMLFGVLILGIFIIVNWYDLYDRWVLQRPLAGSIFYALTIFCVLNFIFPVVFGMRNVWSLLLSGGLSGLFVILLAFPHMGVARSPANALKALGGIALVLAAVWLGRSTIPPAPLRLTAATACRAIESYRPVAPARIIAGSGAQEVFFYSSIFAPLGLSEGIVHVWYHEGKKLLEINVSEIRGGRREGFGTWSWHRPREGAGRYTIEVWTRGGQLLGRGGFIYREAAFQPENEEGGKSNEAE